MPLSRSFSPDTDGQAALEAAVIELQLSGDTAAECVLRTQWQASKVIQREMTGVGFYTTFSVPDSIPAITEQTPRYLGDIQAEIEGLAHGAGFILWIEDGRLSCLEGYSYEDHWPERITSFRVRRGQRGLKAVLKLFDFSAG